MIRRPLPRPSPVCGPILQPIDIRYFPEIALNEAVMEVFGIALAKTLKTKPRQFRLALSSGAFRLRKLLLAAVAIIAMASPAFAQSQSCNPNAQDADKTQPASWLRRPMPNPWSSATVLSAGRPKTVITDASALPAEYLRIRTEPMLGPIGDALRTGKDVPGAVLANIEPVLTIRKA